MGAMKENMSRKRSKDNLEKIAEDADIELTETDFGVSATLQSLSDLQPLLSELNEDKANLNAMVDLGCGYGAVSKILAEYLSIPSICGIDRDEERLDHARTRGITTYNINLEETPLPFSDGEIDLVTSFGVLEHLRYYDNPISESYRVLRERGWILFSVPNLGSWTSRLSLLFGYQPRDVEISSQRAFGISGFYDKVYDRAPLVHIHSVTLNAFKELLEFYGFHIVSVVGFAPYQTSATVKFVDKLFSVKPSWSRRFAVLARK
ncbi:MAG: class I SAM-dependent methyltransferase [Methanomicrobia archaeon]|nr:class I SAM-dependent methyltransferase [Methanomicrobia archaeon]